MLQCSWIVDIFCSLPSTKSSFKNGKLYPKAVIRHVMATEPCHVGSICLPNDKRNLGQVNWKAAVVFAVESSNVIWGQNFVLSRMTKVFLHVLCQHVWDPFTAWPTPFSWSFARIRNSLSYLWSLQSYIKQSDPCFLIFSCTNEAFLMIIIVLTHLRIFKCTVTEYFLIS